MRRVGGALLALAASLSVVFIGAAAGGAPAGAEKPQPIEIGDICSCSGPQASTVGLTTSITDAWVKWVNAHGGIEGHQVNVIVKDDLTNPATSLSEAQKLISNHVVAIFDNTNVDAAWADVAKAAHVPVIGSIGSDPEFSNSDFFTPSATFNHLFSGGIELAMKKAGVTKMAYLYCAEAAACTQAFQSLKSTLAKSSTQQLAYATSINSSAPNFTAPCLAAKQSGATGLAVGDATSVVQEVVADCATQGWHPVGFGNNGTVGIGQLKIPTLNGSVDVLSNYPWFVKGNVTKDMDAALAKYAPSVPTNPNYGPVSVETWILGVELQQALEASKATGATLTAADAIKGLYTFHGNTLGGLAPPLTFTKGKPSDNGCYFLMAQKDGKFVTPYGVKPFCVTTN